MAIQTLDDIPTLSDLYRKGKLISNASHSLVQPSASINARISLIRTDITALKVTAVVNAANSGLRGGGGVDGAIHRAAGPELLAACEPLGGCPTGSAKITAGFELPATHVIHAVGPVYKSGDGKKSANLLAGCYRKSLELAAEAGKIEEGTAGASIAFPCISTGVYGYPSVDACHVAATTARGWLDHEDAEASGNKAGKISRIIFCCFLEKDEQCYKEILPQYFPHTPEQSPDGHNHSGQQPDPVEAPQKTEVPDEDTEEWEKVDKPVPTDEGTLDDARIKPTASGGISEGTQENPGGVDSNAQNQLMKDW